MKRGSDVVVPSPPTVPRRSGPRQVSESSPFIAPPLIVSSPSSPPRRQRDRKNKMSWLSHGSKSCHVSMVHNELERGRGSGHVARVFQQRSRVVRVSPVGGLGS